MIKNTWNKDCIASWIFSFRNNKKNINEVIKLVTNTKIFRIKAIKIGNEYIENIDLNNVIKLINKFIQINKYYEFNIIFDLITKKGNDAYAILVNLNTFDKDINLIIELYSQSLFLEEFIGEQQIFNKIIKELSILTKHTPDFDSEGPQISTVKVGNFINLISEKGIIDYLKFPVKTYEIKDENKPFLLNMKK
jgi:hypothetical protein